MQIVQLDWNELASFTNQAEVVGLGGSSVVFKGDIPVNNHHNLTPQPIVVKMSNSEIGARKMAHELDILLHLAEHENIISCLASSRNNEDEVNEHGRRFNRICLIFPLIGGGNLKSLYMTQELTWPDVLHILHGIVRAITYLHDQNLVHHDIKPDNILLTEDKTVKLIDFGGTYAESTVVSIAMLENTAGFFANFYPDDVVDDDDRTGRSCMKRHDLYSFGVVMMLLATKRPVQIPVSGPFQPPITISRHVRDAAEKKHKLVHADYTKCSKKVAKQYMALAGNLAFARIDTEPVPEQPTLQYITRKIAKWERALKPITARVKDTIKQFLKIDS